MQDRKAFIGHFLLILAMLAGAFFATLYGVPQAIFAADQSYMTSAIVALVCVSVIAIGRAAWSGDARGVEFGHFAVRISVLLGLVGTAVGLSLQARALVGGAAAFGPLATSLFSTMTGAGAAILIEFMTFNLERGARS